MAMDDEGGVPRRVFLRSAGAAAATGLVGLGCGDDAEAGAGEGGGASGATSGPGGTTTSSGPSTSQTSTSGGPGGQGGAGSGGGAGGPGSGGSGPGAGGAGGGTPACEETEDDIEGPFYSEGAPIVQGALPGVDTLPGIPLLLRGRVHTASTCEALAGAVLDLWQADDAGVYDNEGFTLRGKVETAADGSFEVRTIVPGHYLNGSQYRPAHLHVKVSAPGHALLTTQLYFPDDPYNEIDPWFDERLLIAVEPGEGIDLGTFDFFLVPG